MLSRPVDEAEAHYLRETVLPRMRPLSDEEYESGPAAILHTMARFSYVLEKGDIYWCVEWQPGLLVLRFTPDGAMSWAALDSPNPEFGGPDATPEEIAAYDEDAENPQYNLVFEAWDAQFEEDRQIEWEEADPRTRRRFKQALAHVNAPGEKLQTRYADKADYERWLERCKTSMIWNGPQAGASSPPEV